MRRSRPGSQRRLAGANRIAQLEARSRHIVYALMAFAIGLGIALVVISPGWTDRLWFATVAVALAYGLYRMVKAGPRW